MAHYWSVGSSTRKSGANSETTVPGRQNSSHIDVYLHKIFNLLIQLK